MQSLLELTSASIWRAGTATGPYLGSEQPPGRQLDTPEDLSPSRVQQGAGGSELISSAGD